MNGARDVWARIRSSILLEVLWDLTPHSSRVGQRYRVTRTTSMAASGTIVPGRVPFRFRRYRAGEVRIDGLDTYTVFENG